MIPTRQEAEASRDTGMALAEDKANRDTTGWSERARASVVMFCLNNHGRRFLMEEVRAWAESEKLIDPPDNAKAWGGVTRRCANEGIIRQAGYMPAKSSNLSPKCAWEAA